MKFKEEDSVAAVALVVESSEGDSAEGQDELAAGEASEEAVAVVDAVDEAVIELDDLDDDADAPDDE